MTTPVTHHPGVPPKTTLGSGTDPGTSASASIAAEPPRAKRHPRIALVGTYPPTQCGIASFTASLRTAMAIGEQAPDVIRVLDDEAPDTYSPEVVYTMRPGDPASIRGAAAALAGYEAVVVQHEYGIYGPASGMAAVDLVESLWPPAIVTFHTVMKNPTPAEQLILERLSHGCRRTVVLSEVARSLLIDRYRIDPPAVEVIPHGTAPADEPRATDEPRRSLDHPTLLTWGLIGPGKGLEWAIRSLSLLRRTFPRIRYVIAGRTHPKVVAREGEAYRRKLEALIRQLGLQSHVSMVDRYLPPEQLNSLLRRASLVVLPYDSTQQTSSGVLVEAVTAGVPVVATAFPQAVEIADGGGAETVPHRDPDALAAAARILLTDRSAVARMLAAQREIAARSSWEEVGRSYLRLVNTLVAEAAA